MRIPRNESSEPHVPSVNPDQVLERVQSFLEHCWDFPLVDWDTLGRIKGRNGKERMALLLAQTGFVENPEGFALALATALEQPQTSPVRLGGVQLPYQLLLAVMEVLLPGQGFETIKKVNQLEELTGLTIPTNEHQDLQRVIDTYPVRLSLHTVRQLRLSPMVARQYMPFVDELNREGEVHTWVGQFFRGIVEQMYQNRVIFIMNMACPVYCRFCFRKHKECRNQRSPAKAHVKQAVLYIHEAPLIKEIVLTGGDPFMNRATLQYAVQELAKVPHVQTLRLASRAVSYYPAMFLRDDAYWLNYLVRTNLELSQRGKRLELATHFIHPDELSYDALDVISHLVSHGVNVYVQTPFVNGCNETGEAMVHMFNTLRGAGAEIHYIFMPTSPIQGNRIYWSTIEQGLRAGRHLRARLSDRALPHITTATSIGKIDWNTSGWAVEPHDDDDNRLWIRTPYTKEYYEEFAPIMQVGQRVRENLEGTLDATFHTKIGSDELFVGPRGLTSSPEAFQYKLDQTREHVEGFLPILQQTALEDQRQLGLSIGGRPCPPLARQHRTRVELDCGAPVPDLEAALAHIGAHREITDVVLSRRDDTLSVLSTTARIIDRLIQIPHVLAVRLRSLKLVHAPESIPRAAVARLAGLNRLQVIRPTRLEIETQLLHSSEVRPELGRLVRDLRLRGITVYNNTPLLGYINDNEEEMLRISSICRELGIEFCNVYVAGLPIQDDWNEQFPIELNSVVDIATHVRRHGSGREVPRYVLRTVLGEVDFSIAPRIFVPDPDGAASVRVRLLERDLEHFRAIAPDFKWPHDVTVDELGQPLVPVSGISLENQEFLFAPVTEGTKEGA